MAEWTTTTLRQVRIYHARILNSSMVFKSLLEEKCVVESVSHWDRENRSHDCEIKFIQEFWLWLDSVLQEVERLVSIHWFRWNWAWLVSKFYWPELHRVYGVQLRGRWESMQKHNLKAYFKAVWAKTAGVEHGGIHSLIASLLHHTYAVFYAKRPSSKYWLHILSIKILFNITCFFY